MRIPIKLAEIRALTHGFLLRLSLSVRGLCSARGANYSLRAQTVVPVSPPLYMHGLYSIQESGYGLRPPVAR
jgi:hypothetical protein